MIIDKKSWHYGMVKYSYLTKNLPKSLCGYFWQLVISMILFPISYPIFIYNKYLIKYHSKVDMYNINALMSILIWLLGFIISISIYNNTIGNDVNLFYFIITSTLVGFISTILLKFFIDFVIFLIFKIGDFIDELEFNRIYYKIENNNIKSNIFLEYLKAVKNKICPFIEYKD
jgi:hypothetical protein